MEQIPTHILDDIPPIASCPASEKSIWEYNGPVLIILWGFLKVDACL